MPGKNKIQKKKVLTSGGIIPFLTLSMIILYLIYYSNISFSFYFKSIPQIWIAPASIIIFAILSFYDDFRYIPFQIRLLIQLSIIYLCISLFPINPQFNFQTPIFNGLLPIKLDIILTIIFWTFIINSTNFIDGYDGMFSFQIISNFAGFSLIFFLLNENFHFLTSILMLIIGTVFLPFNIFRKFKMYIGDAGSIPAGFMIGWMTISLANMGYFVSAILINLFFLSDVLITLIRRIFKKKSIFKRHNEFFFKQTIVKKGFKTYILFAVPIQIITILMSIKLVLN